MKKNSVKAISKNPPFPLFWKGIKGEVKQKKWVFRDALNMLVALLLLSAIGCTMHKKIESPPGFDFTKPAIFSMPPELEEISGITFRNNNPDTIFAEQDEEGKVFCFRLGDEQVSHSKFARKGDYEDVAACNNYMILLRSDGVLFSFPADELHNKESGNVQEQKDLLPDGEYEAMYADEASSMVYVLCKQCGGDKKSESVSGYTLLLETDGGLLMKDKFSIDVKAVEDLTGGSALSFRPSALAKNPLTKQWYIVSSVNKLLLVTDATWKPLQVYSLNPATFNQPEGMAFDKSGNLYISNEKGNAGAGTILKFTYNGGKP